MVWYWLRNKYAEKLSMIWSHITFCFVDQPPNLSWLIKIIATTYATTRPTLFKSPGPESEIFTSGYINEKVG